MADAVLFHAEERLVPESRALLRRLVKDRASLLGLTLVAVFALAALFAPVLATQHPDQTDFSNRFASPSAEHPLGTDHLGRDELARLLHGGRLSLGMALSATTGITLLGVGLGLAAAVYGRFVETVVMRLVDILLSIPTLIQALVVVGLLGQGLRNLIITIVFVQWPRYARLVRGMALKVREQTFVEAARAAGGSRTWIAVRHILPNLIGPMVVFSTVDMGSTLLAVSGLSFLGFGVPPPTAEWGAMLSEARFQIERAPQLLLYPGVAITLVVLGFNLAGDALRDLLDPRTLVTGTSGRKRGRRRRGARVAEPTDVDGRRSGPPAVRTEVVDRTARFVPFRPLQFLSRICISLPFRANAGVDRRRAGGSRSGRKHDGRFGLWRRAAGGPRPAGGGRSRRRRRGGAGRAGAAPMGRWAGRRPSEGGGRPLA